MNDYRDMKWYDGPDAQEPDEPDVTRAPRSSRAPVIATTAVLAAAVAGGAVWFAKSGDDKPAPSAPVAAASSSSTSAPQPSQPSDPASWASSPSTMPSSATDTEAAKPAPTMTLTDADRKKVQSEAVAVVSAFVAKGKDQKAWWDELKPRMSDQAQKDYAQTDPRKVPGKKAESKTRILPGAIGETATVGVLTDAGEFEVLMTRSHDKPDWKAERITLPPSEAGDS